MKKLLVAGIAAAALYGAPALAADYPMKAAPAPAVFNWSGFYIGVNGGGEWNTTDGIFIDFPGVTWHTDRKTAGTAGLHGGVQGQWGNFVAGVEGGFNAMFGGFGSGVGAGPSAPCGYTGVNCQARTNDILTAGGRVGWAWDRVLFYGSGGYARALIETRGLFTVSGAVIDDASAHHDGWYGGAGIEYALLNNLTFGVDWKHFGFSSQNHITHSPCCGDQINISAKGDAVTARLTIKGGG
jgi:outer membrane immunogenic protein